MVTSIEAKFNNFTAQQEQIIDLQNQITALQNKLKSLNYPSVSGQFVKVGNNTRYIQYNSIIMIEAQLHCTFIYLSDSSKILSSQPLKYWENIFSSGSMIRIHKSYLINTEHVNSICRKTRIIQMNNGCKACYSRNLKSVLFSPSIQK